MYYAYCLYGVVLSAVLLLFMKRLRRRQSLAHIVGPKPSSWLAGNLSDLQRPDNSIGDTDFAWLDQYGCAIKIKGSFGKDLLFLADPKGLQYVLNTSGYNFPKTKERRALFLFVTGPGLVFADGSQHVRQRKVMNPAFSYNALKGFLPLFFRTAEKLSGKWRDLIQENESQHTTIDVSHWLARMTLDAIGEAAFNYQFNSLDNLDNELAAAFGGLLDETLARPKNTTIAAQAAMNYLPFWIHKVVIRIPSKPIKRLAHYLSTARRVAQRLVAREWDAVYKGRPVGKDIMSILIRANGSENPKRRLSNEEIYAQITTLMLAGHETTASSVTWILYELSKRPDIQDKIRNEIKAARASTTNRDREDFTIPDLESMSYTHATIKETLRFHPVGPWTAREAAHDDVIPLSIPQRTVSGEYVNSIHIRRGQGILVSFCAYNRLKSVWGPDADQWRPERFVEGFQSEQNVKLGAIANLATFSSGVRNCIGWRFAMLEMQAVLMELVENFEFSLSDVEIVRTYAGAMVPMVKGQIERGTQMPLIVRPIS